MIAVDIDRIPDGPVGEFISAKAVLRAAIACSPDLGRQVSALVGAILLIVKDEPAASNILNAVAQGIQCAAQLPTLLVIVPPQPRGEPS